MLKTVGNPSTRYGDQTIVDGDLVIGTSGSGVDFSANPHAPGMTSELLNDYEEGAWTPSIGGSGGNPTITYTAATGGYYTKIGNVVHFTFEVRWDSISGGAGNVVIFGLPYARKTSTANDSDRCALQSFATTYSGDTLMASVSSGNTFMSVDTNDPAGGATIPVPISGLGLTFGIGFLRGSGFYFV